MHGLDTTGMLKGLERQRIPYPNPQPSLSPQSSILAETDFAGGKQRASAGEGGSVYAGDTDRDDMGLLAHAAPDANTPITGPDGSNMAPPS